MTIVIETVPNILVKNIEIWKIHRRIYTINIRAMIKSTRIPTRYT